MLQNERSFTQRPQRTSERIDLVQVFLRTQRENPADFIELFK